MLHLSSPRYPFLTKFTVHRELFIDESRLQGSRLGVESGAPLPALLRDILEYDEDHSDLVLGCDASRRILYQQMDFVPVRKWYAPIFTDLNK